MEECLCGVTEIKPVVAVADDPPEEGVVIEWCRVVYNSSKN